jgi:hypothetical protein
MARAHKARMARSDIGQSDSSSSRLLTNAGNQASIPPYPPGSHGNVLVNCTSQYFLILIHTCLYLFILIPTHPPWPHGRLPPQRQRVIMLAQGPEHGAPVLRCHEVDNCLCQHVVASTPGCIPHLRGSDRRKPGDQTNSMLFCGFPTDLHPVHKVIKWITTVSGGLLLGTAGMLPVHAASAPARGFNTQHPWQENWVMSGAACDQ